MRSRVYILTFLGYIMMHSLRMGYSYCKPYFKVQYQLPNLFLAVLDSCIYFALGIGFLLRFFLVSSRKLFPFLVTSIIFALAYSMFPILSLTNILSNSNIEICMMLLMLAYGFFQFSFWPTSLTLVKDYYSNEQDGCLLGFWSSAGDFGNIIGFMVPSFLILQFQLQWQIPLLGFAILLILVCSAIYIFTERKDKRLHNKIDEDHSRQQTNIIPVEEDIKGSQFCQFALQSLGKSQKIIFLLIACCFKALLYTFLLWLPTYIDSKGQKQLSAQIPVIFNLATIVGSFLIGLLYQKNENNNSSHIVAQYILALLSLMVIGGLIVINMASFSVLLFGFMIGVQGFAIGGIFNTIICIETIQLSKGNTHQMNMLTSLSMGVANISIGLIELIIGISLAQTEDQDQSTAYDGIFKVLLGVSILAAVLLCIRGWLAHSNDKVRGEQLQISQ